ncbi:hypothetical protein J690_2118 [Acinetobacter sp. 742879]|nr:hypothetical protein J580_2289 [Acinetobacter sp. 1542444]EXS14296.1 hypothetical protein J672_2558 [Acinetobacter sp. 883425]EXS23123.1 hypothetical protein J658_2100 [Acinetobacter baumannii 573719]EXS28250.1 hypothetical protein J690_2118 [Acinetobacter sp. 742879]
MRLVHIVVTRIAAEKTFQLTLLCRFVPMSILYLLKMEHPLG